MATGDKWLVREESARNVHTQMKSTASADVIKSWVLKAKINSVFSGSIMMDRQDKED